MNAIDALPTPDVQAPRPANAAGVAKADAGKTADARKADKAGDQAKFKDLLSAETKDSNDTATQAPDETPPAQLGAKPDKVAKDKIIKGGHASAASARPAKPAGKTIADATPDPTAVVAAATDKPALKLAITPDAGAKPADADSATGAETVPDAGMATNAETGAAAAAATGAAVAGAVVTAPIAAPQTTATAITATPIAAVDTSAKPAAPAPAPKAEGVAKSDAAPDALPAVATAPADGAVSADPKAAANAPAAAPAQPADAAPAEHAKAGPHVSAASATIEARPAAEGAPVSPPPAANAAAAAPPAAPAAQIAADPAGGASTVPAALRAAPEAAVQVYHRIVERNDGRSQRFEMRLDPAELGRVDIRIEVNADKKVHAILAVHDSAALSDLVKGQRSLEQALTDSGLDLAEGGLKFELSADTGRSFGGSEGRGQTGYEPGFFAGADRASLIALPATPETAAVAQPSWRPQRLNLVA